MSDKTSFENESIKSFRVENIAVLNIKGNVFDGVVNFAESEPFFQLLSDINNDKSIHAFFIMNEPGALGSEAYAKFICQNVVGEDCIKKGLRFKSEKVTINRVREINILKRVILKLVDFNKLFVFGLDGDIVTPFFGLSLAATFRFATADMTFKLDHRKFGLHPSGALPFFLSHYVTKNIQSEILYYKDEIDAEEAQSLGLVNKIIDDNNFLEGSLEEIGRILEKNSGSVNMTRILSGYSINTLIHYFDKESLFI